MEQGNGTGLSQGLEVLCRGVLLQNLASLLCRSPGRRGQAGAVPCSAMPCHAAPCRAMLHAVREQWCFRAFC